MKKHREKWRIGNSQALAAFVTFANEKLHQGAFTIRVEPDKRSLAQNDKIYALYGEINALVDDHSLIEIRRICKLCCGVPILRANDPAFRQLYDGAIRHNLEFELKLIAMDILPVTSRMNKAQGSEYISSVIRYWQERGVYIQHPEDEAYEQYAAGNTA